MSQLNIITRSKAIKNFLDFYPVEDNYQLIEEWKELPPEQLLKAYNDMMSVSDLDMIHQIVEDNELPKM